MEEDQRENIESPPELEVKTPSPKKNKKPQARVEDNIEDVIIEKNKRIEEAQKQELDEIERSKIRCSPKNKKLAEHAEHREKSVRPPPPPPKNEDEEPLPQKKYAHKMPDYLSAISSFSKKYNIKIHESPKKPPKKITK